MITIKRQVHFKAGTKGQKQIRPGKKPDQPSTRVPRISRLVALAIHFDKLLRDGNVKDLAELARLGHVTRARLTQVMNLLNLAPEIQETLLFLPAVEQGREEVTERSLRRISALPSWTAQQRMWNPAERVGTE